VLRTGILVAGVATLALLPLFGDTTPGDAVTHPEWARMILRGLDLLDDDAGGINRTASLAFATLSGRDSRSWSADRYIRGQRIEVVVQDDTRLVRPTEGIGEAVYGMAVARAGDYRLRLQVAGPGPAEAEIANLGEDEVLRSFVVPARPVMGWIDAGTVHLDLGAYDASVLLPPGATLEHLELAPPCLHPIEPAGGWQPTSIATTEDVAVTLLQTLDLEHELPPAAAPLEYRGTDLKLEDGAAPPDTSTSPAEQGTFRGGPRGAQVVLLAEIPEDGLYTLSVLGESTGGQRWMADGCRKCVVCPSTNPNSQWRVVLSGRFSKGPHVFEASLGPNTVIERIRFEQKKDDPADYVGVVERLGLELGPEGPITRDKAEEARRWLERQKTRMLDELCGDILAPGTLIAQLTGGGPGGGGGGEGGGEGGGGPARGPEGGGGGGGVPPPVIPPLPPGSPTLPDAFSD
jgi:hypothetical protein